MKKTVILIVSLFFISTFISSCDKTQPGGGTTPTGKIKEPVIDIPAESAAYKTLWKSVEDYRGKGLPKSSLKVVNRIYSKASKEENAGQIIKALIHKIYYIQQVEEETIVTIQAELNRELKKSSHPVTPVLHSMIAEQYWNYYQRNRYRFLKRSTAKKVKQDDMRTWDLRKIVEEVVAHYEKSLEKPELLKKIKIDIYDEVLYRGNSQRKYRPTLYDFLAHRAIDFYMNQEAGLTRPVYRFSMNNTDYLLKEESFTALKLQTKEKLSFHYFALVYLQDMMRFHKSDRDPTALIDADLKRLRFVHKRAVLPGKERIFETVLKGMIERYKEHPSAAEIYHELGNLYNNQGNTYKAGRLPQYQWHKKKAWDLCKEAMEKYPKSTGAKYCKDLVVRIEAKRLQTTVEKAAIPRKPVKALLKYRNIDKIYVKAVKTTREEYREQQKKNYKKMVAFYAKKQGVRKEIIDLPGEKDFQENYTEIKTGSLVPGKYMILASNSPDFNFDKNIVSYSQMEVSRISYMSRKRGNDLLEFYVMDRSTGQPLRNVRAQLMYRKYSNTWGKYYDKKGKVFKTNKHGYFKISQKSKVENYFHIEFRKGKDVLYTENSFSLYRPYQRYRKYVRTVFFVDRGIYRPGQTVYFKGIKLRTDTKDGEKNKILKNYGATITLYDRNRQKVATLKRRTNEYGTFSGSFTLPTGLINGNMFIDDGHGRVNFSVEEYKRPKFEVSFKPLEKTFRLNDTVTVTGTAKAYAGYPIDNAQVKFRVVRTAFYPYRWYWWSYTPPSPSMEIKNGVVKTDEKGKYEITFKAIPDESLLKKNKPAFRYMVYADITDINGETRSSTKTVTIGYTALMLRMHIAGELDRDKGRYAYSINSTNLSGEFAAAAGKIAVYKLREPGRIFRRRLWRKPNTFAIKKDKFYRLFPNDVYDNENNIRAWKRGKKVHTQIYDTGKNKKLAFTGIKRWKTGKYLVEMTAKDRYGNDVKEIKYFTLYSSRGKKVPYPLLNWFTIPKSRVEPGGKAVILIGTSEKNVRVLYELEYRGSIIKKKYLRLNNEQKKITIPIKEKHRGNIGVRLSFIRHNRIFTHSRSIYVPWTNKELDVSFGTFRNKLNPGEKEKWRIRIKGKKKDLVAAEMVATLYDASLDAFRANHWSFNIYPGHYPLYSWGRDRYFNTRSSHSIGKTKEHYWYARKTYDRLNWYGFYWRYYSRKSRRYKNGGGSIRGMSRVSRDEAPLALEEVKESEEDSEAIADAPRSLKKKTKGKALAGNGKPAPSPEKLNGKAEDNGHATAEAAPVKVRTNFSETAFFYPHLKTNKNGEVIISFEIPEALTKWKMMGFAHTKKLEYGFVYNELVTQKELMVVPNLPRFFREGDSMTLTSKITNLTEDKLSGKAKLFLFDAATMKPLNGQFKNRSSETAFTARKGGSALVRWNIAIPENVDAVTYRVTARAGKFSDGEEQALPVLKNRMLVTESMPLPVRSKQTKHFTFKKLVNSGDSTTLRHHKVTLEFTSNPAWYAVQALPYLMEYPFECMEQTFSRYYANSIASHIVNTNPKIKRVFDVWQKTKGSNALLSNLEKNQELKSLLLQETPWVMDANNETERKKRISVLFNFNRMANELGRALKKLEEGQLSSGAWSWFKGMRENRYITRHIVSGFAHLGQLKVKDLRKDKRIWKMVKKAVHYLDRKIREDYESLKRREVDMSLRHIGYHQIHYLYARSYFKDIEFYKWDKEAFEYYKGQAKKYWLDFNRYSQGMISLAMDRYKEKETALAIVKSIKEHALYSEEMGMYWKDSYGYYWYQAPIETHALLIEVFSEVADDQKSVDDLKTWLLKQKQTQDWKTTKATANACYALLLRGDDWLKENKLAEITLGSMKIEPKKMDSVKVEAGTGYFKTSWSGADIKPEMGKVKVVNRNNVVAWGALYWQYFENLDKITPHETPLKLKKQLFVERSSDTGPVLFPLDKSAPKIGDRIKVRIELRVDRTMEYVHMKDMRASGFEPENVISRYKWQDGLGYYESTKDASTNFFFDYLPKGTYVFEYPLRVTHEGDFSNGITQIQCMYAPEFTSHSEGVRVKVGD